MILVILGPTCSHKSSLGDIILKDNIINNNKPSLIINFDCFQIYKEMNIGVAKPSKEELNNPSYLLYDYLPLDTSFDISKYQILGREIIEKYKDTHNLIFIGGSGLYIKSLLFDYHFEEENSEEKIKIEQELDKLSNSELYNLLQELDYNESLKISINNRKRLIRALTLIKLFNKTKEEINQNNKDKLLYKDTLFIYLNPPREELYSSINKRVDIMFQEGLKEEALSLIKKYGKELRSLQAIGYKEFFDYDYLLEKLKNEEEVITFIKERIKKNTRNYSKRQITFFNHQFKNVNLYQFKSIDEAKEFLLNYNFN